MPNDFKYEYFVIQKHGHEYYDASNAEDIMRHIRREQEEYLDMNDDLPESDVDSQDSNREDAEANDYPEEQSSSENNDDEQDGLG